MGEVVDASLTDTDQLCVRNLGPQPGGDTGPEMCESSTRLKPSNPNHTQGPGLCPSEGKWLCYAAETEVHIRTAQTRLLPTKADISIAARPGAEDHT